VAADPARGYRFVLVNGESTLEEDRETGVHAGRLLQHGAAEARAQRRPAGDAHDGSAGDRSA
jgi:hypothetical protein